MFPKFNYIFHLPFLDFVNLRVINFKATHKNKRINIKYSPSLIFTWWGEGAILENSHLTQEQCRLQTKRVHLLEKHFLEIWDLDNRRKMK